jgi:hypothetical protein
VKVRLLIRKPLAYELNPRRFKFRTYPIVTQLATHCPSGLACSRVRCWILHRTREACRSSRLRFHGFTRGMSRTALLCSEASVPWDLRARPDVSIVAPRYEQIRCATTSERQTRLCSGSPVHSLVIGTFTYVSHIIWTGALRGETATCPIDIPLGDVHEVRNTVDGGVHTPAQAENYCEHRSGFATLTVPARVVFIVLSLVATVARYKSMPQILLLISATTQA